MRLIIIFILIGLLTVMLLQAESMNMVRIGSIQNWNGKAMDIADNLAVVAAGSKGLHILDLADPERIYEAGFLMHPGDAYGVVVDNEYAYVAAGWAGLEIIDLSDHRYPSEAAYFDEIPEVAVDVAFSEEIVCIAYDGGGIAVCGVENVESPRLISRIEPDRSVDAVVMQDRLLIASGEQFGTRLYDLTDPDSPQEISHIDGGYLDLQIFGSKLLVCGSSIVMCWDISDPVHPVESGTIAVDRPTDIAVSATGENALVARREGWSLLAIDEHGRLSLVFADESQRTTRGVGFVNDDAVIMPSVGLETYSLVNLRNPVRVGMACNIGGILGVEKVGDYAVSLGGLMSVIDVSDPARPVVLSTTSIPGSADPLKYTAPLAFIPCEDLRVFDLSDPRNPELLGTFETESGMNNRDVDVEDSRAALINQDNLYMVDVSNPRNMRMTGHYYTANNVFFRNIDLVGDLIYAASTAGLLIFDVSEPRNLERIGVLNCPAGGYYDVVVEGSIAYASGGPYYANDPGLFIIDVSDPFNSIELGSCPLPAAPRSITKAGNWVYVADNWAGVQAIDVSDPEHPVNVGYWTEESDNYYGATAFDHFVITADRYKGLSVFQNTYVPLIVNPNPTATPEQFQLVSYPNPFNSTARIQATLPAAGFWSLKVYGVKGIEVADLGSGWKLAGEITASFDAQQTPPGNYFIRLEGTGGSVTKRMVLIK